MTPRSLRLILTLAMITALADLSLAQEPSRQAPAKPRPARPAQRAIVEQQQKPEPEPVDPSLEPTLPRVMADLAEQIDKLTTELRLLRKETQRNSTAMELMLHEERLSKVESKLDDLNAAKSQLEAREQELQRRMRNIQQELVFRAGPILRRDEAEAAIRSELQRALDDTRAQKETNQQRISELQNQAEYLRRRIEALRKKFEQLETKVEDRER